MTYNTLLVGHGRLQLANGGDVTSILARDDSSSLSNHCENIDGERKSFLSQGLTATKYRIFLRVVTGCHVKAFLLRQNRGTKSYHNGMSRAAVCFHPF
jgi:hypothetical protein